eukprot:m.988009 g.988009  ORF g.988009 m.988009 type:complete len:848 (-) comp23991_c0_seq5:351-2894(-)
MITRCCENGASYYTCVCVANVVLCRLDMIPAPKATHSSAETMSSSPLERAKKKYSGWSGAVSYHATTSTAKKPVSPMVSQETSGPETVSPAKHPDPSIKASATHDVSKSSVSSLHQSRKSPIVSTPSAPTTPVRTRIPSSDSSQAISMLSESMKYLSTSSSYIPPKVPRPRSQLPVGHSAVHTLVARNDIDVTPPSAVAQSPFSEEARRHRRISASKVEGWSQKKAEQQRVQRTLTRQSQQRKTEEKKLKAKKNEGAFDKWMQKKKQKQQQQHSAANSSTKRSTFTGASLHIDEMVAALRRCQVDPDLLELFETLLPRLDKSGRRKVHREKFLDLMEQVSVQDRVRRKMSALRAKANANPLPDNPKDFTPELRAQIQRENLEQRIGESILRRHGQTRKQFVAFLKRAQATFIQADEAGAGRLKESLFKDCLKALDLGISAGNQVELVKALRKKQAETIDYGLFGDFLVQAEAKRQMDPEYVRQDSDAFSLATAMCKFDTTQGIRECFTDVHADALEYRKMVNTGKGGWILAKDFKSEISAIPDGLSMTKRKDLHKAIESMCKIADKDKDGLIEITAIDLFLRMMEKDLAINRTLARKPADLRRREDSLHRFLKIAIGNFEQYVGKFDQLMALVEEGFQSSGCDDDNDSMTSAEFITTTRKLSIGLSTVQIEDLARVLLQLNGGALISRSMVVAVFRRSKVRMDTEHARKQDPRSALCNAVFRSLGPVPPELPAILADYQATLMTWGSPSPGPGSPGDDNDISNGKSPDHNNPINEERPKQSNNFDVSWGRISMPPGDVSAASTALNVIHRTPKKSNFDASMDLSESFASSSSRRTPGGRRSSVTRTT